MFLVLFNLILFYQLFGQCIMRMHTLHDPYALEHYLSICSLHVNVWHQCKSQSVTERHKRLSFYV